MFPFVRLVDSGGYEYANGIEFIGGVRAQLEYDRAERARIAANMSAHRTAGDGPTKGIDDFRADPRYGGDGTRIDLAYAVYALSHGAAEADVVAALRTRDLTHKGGAKRQDDYLQRTLQKAGVAVRGELSR